MKKKICLDESQTERLLTDTYRMGKGIDDDTICPTVKGMVEENVPADIRVRGKSKKKKDNKPSWIERKVTGKIGKAIDDFF